MKIKRELVEEVLPKLQEEWGRKNTSDRTISHGYFPDVFLLEGKGEIVEAIRCIVYGEKGSGCSEMVAIGDRMWADVLVRCAKDDRNPLGIVRLGLFRYPVLDNVYWWGRGLRILNQSSIPFYLLSLGSRNRECIVGQNGVWMEDGIEVV